MTVIPPLVPPSGPARRAFRQSLLADPVLAVAGFLRSYPGSYGRLATERASHAPRPELEAEALALAADIATVMQSLRSQAASLATDDAGRTVALPLVELDQLFSALVLLAGDTTAGIPDEMLLDGEQLSLAISTPAVSDFLAGVEATDG